MDDLLAALRTALERIGDRWTLLIVAALFDRPRRFGALQAAVDGIAPNVLSQRLKAMEADGLVVATPYQQRPIRLVYELTAGGRELGATVRLLAAWGADDTAGPTHPACGTPLDVVWWCPTCDVAAEAPDHQLQHV